MYHIITYIMGQVSLNAVLTSIALHIMYIHIPRFSTASAIPSPGAVTVIVLFIFKD